MKKLSTLFILLFIATEMFSQGISPNWFKTYNRTSGRGDVLINQKANNDFLTYHSGTFLALNANGDSLYTFSHAPFFPNQIANLNGSMFLIGDESGFPQIAKLDANDSIDWSKTVYPNSGELHAAILSSNNEIICVGEAGFSEILIAKTDLNGDTAWARVYDQNSFTALTDVTELTDGNFVGSGYVDDYGFAMKFDNNGDTLWTYQTPNFISLGITAIHELANGEILFIARNNVITLDASGNELTRISYNEKDFTSLAAANGNFYLMGGIDDGANIYPYVEVLDGNLDSTASYLQVNNIWGPDYTIFDDHVVTATGGIIAAGEVEDSVSAGNGDNLIGLLLFNDAPSGLSEMNFLKTEKLSVFPSPAQNKTNLFFDELFSGEIKLMDQKGKLVWQQTTTATKTVNLNLSGISNGIYFIQATNGESFYSAKLVVNH